MRALAIILAFVLAGCSASHPAAECPDVDDVLAWRQRTSALACARALRCYNDGMSAGGVALWCGLPFEGRAELCSALAAGLTFHPDRARACLDATMAALADTPCRRPFDPLDSELYGPETAAYHAACGAVLDGEVDRPPYSDACGCSSQEFCVAGETCGTRCIPFPVEGEHCSFICAWPLHCDVVTRTCRSGCVRNLECGPGQYCIGGACSAATLPVLGEPCLDTEDGILCAGTHTYCHDVTHTCEERVDGDVPCDASGGPDACFMGTCDPTSGRCVGVAPCFPPPPVGRSCTPSRPYCDVDHQCTTETTRAVCGSSVFEQCPTGSACDWRGSTTEGRCRPRAHVGDRCDAAVICDDGTTCSGAVCVAVAADGQACGASGAACVPPLTCVAGRCERTTRNGNIGDRCTPTMNCLLGACTDGICQWAPVGAQVESPEACQSLRTMPCGDALCCAEYAFVGEGEDCDSSMRRCNEGSLCVPTGLPGTPGRRSICRAPCP